MSSIFFAVQFEFTHAIGPHAGRYVVAHESALDERGAALRATDLSRRERLTGVTMSRLTADVLAITVVAAQAAKRTRLLRRAREHDVTGAASEVPLLLATFIRGTEPVMSADAASERLLRIADDEDAQREWVTAGLAVLNRAIRAYRTGARDPYVTEVARRDARAVRIGFGTTEDLPDGRFLRAAVLPPPLGHRPSREEKLVPAETTADVLAGRVALLDGEDVLLRAYVDLDHARPRAAALQLSAGLRLLALELAARDDGDLDLTALAARAAALVADDALAAVAAGDVEAILDEVERALERWRCARLEL